MTPTVPKTALAGVIVERLSAIFKPSMAISNEERASSRRFDCLDFGSMGSRSGEERKDVASGRLCGRPWTLIEMSGDHWCGALHNAEPFKEAVAA